MTNLEEQTISSEIIYNGRVISIRKDTVLLPNGEESFREIVWHPGAVAVVPLLDSGLIVMVKQYRQTVGEVLLEIPAGTLEPGELPVVCAKRELQEEVGYLPNKLKLLCSSYLAPGYSSEILHTFLAEDLVTSTANNDEDEFIETFEIPLEDVEKMVMSGEIRDAKTICGVLMAIRLFEGPC